MGTDAPAEPPATSRLVGGWLIGVPDRARAVLGELVTLAMTGHLRIQADRAGYTVVRAAPDRLGLLPDQVVLLAELLGGRAEIRLPGSGGGAPTGGGPPAARLSAGTLDRGVRRAAARQGYLSPARWLFVAGLTIAATMTVYALWNRDFLVATGFGAAAALLGGVLLRPAQLSAAGVAEQQRILDLRDRLHRADDEMHADPRLLPWAILLLDTDRLDDWYARLLAVAGPPSWWQHGERDPAGHPPVMTPAPMTALLAAVTRRIGA